ncbi:helix-turn-helix domain-containing protein [Pseudonocardia ailaonensis]|uniref:TetR/AcrR family transcriptional regulator n=1 Tax=Pseudonocardia ailaonensis TaxID=367279 RepID=UPI0031E245F9
MPILTAAFSCVGRKGVSGLSVREVARLTGLSTGSVTHHFPTRRDLLHSAIDFGFERLVPELGALEPGTGLGVLLEHYDLSDAARRSWWRFVFALMFEAESSPDIATRLEQGCQVGMDRWRTVLEQERELGRVREDVDVGEAARTLVAVGNGVILAQLIMSADAGSAVADLAGAVHSLRPHPEPAAR